MAERQRRHVSAAHLARCTGLSSRWFTGRAAEGKIPGAYQPGGERGAWRFDEELFWRWWDGVAYQIHGINDRGTRGGLGGPLYQVLVLAVEHAPRDEALVGEHIEFTWDKRKGRKSRRLSELAGEQRS